jgi:hypothetical protein
MRKTKENARKAIVAAIKDLFIYDEDCADESVEAGDPWGYGSEAATITTENNMHCLNYYDADWISNARKIEDHVKKNAGLDIFIECYNPAIHCVYWD